MKTTVTPVFSNTPLIQTSKWTTAFFFFKKLHLSQIVPSKKRIKHLNHQQRITSSVMRTKQSAAVMEQLITYSVIRTEEYTVAMEQLIVITCSVKFTKQCVVGCRRTVLREGTPMNLHKKECEAHKIKEGRKKKKERTVGRHLHSFLNKDKLTL